MSLKLANVILWRLLLLLSNSVPCVECLCVNHRGNCILSLQLPSIFNRNRNRNRNWIVCHGLQKGLRNDEFRTCMMSWNPHLRNYRFPYFTSRSVHSYRISRSASVLSSFFYFFLFPFVQFVTFKVHHSCYIPVINE